MSVISEIRKELFSMRDNEYRDFQSKLLPSVDSGTFVGVRTPDLRGMAKRWGKRPDAGVFLKDLPHAYFDENQLHAFIISAIKEYEPCVKEVSLFLPYVDNWATCDQLSPKVLKKQNFHENVLVKIDEWIKSSRTYTVRFAIKLLMQYFLDDEFKPEYLEKVAAVQSEEYYIKMMVAWYFATALAKQWDATLSFIKEKRLEGWTHNKAIQKAIESYRITPEQKDLLRGMKL